MRLSKRKVRKAFGGNALLQAKRKEAAENLATFFADQASQMMTQLLGQALNSLTKSLGGSIGGGIGGFLGGLLGGLIPGFGAFTTKKFNFGSGKELPFGAFANGGPVFGNTPIIVGERGTELFVPRQDGFIVNQQQAASAAARGAGGSGGGIVVTNHFVIQAPQGRVDSRTQDQIADSVYRALTRASRNRGA